MVLKIQSMGLFVIFEHGIGVCERVVLYAKKVNTTLDSISFAKTLATIDFGSTQTGAPGV